MTEAQLRRVVAGILSSNESDLDESCFYLKPEAKGLGFMMPSSRCARIDVTEGPWRTVSGAGIGTSETEIHRLYGSQVHVEPHHYDDQGNWKYLIVHSKDELLFETDGEIVTSFRAGLAKAVTYVEGCA
jgi:hypothetical protein